MFWGLFVFPGHSTRERQSSVMTIQQDDVFYSADPRIKKKNCVGCANQDRFRRRKSVGGTGKVEIIKKFLEVGEVCNMTIS